MRSEQHVPVDRLWRRADVIWRWRRQLWRCCGTDLRFLHPATTHQWPQAWLHPSYLCLPLPFAELFPLNGLCGRRSAAAAKISSRPIRGAFRLKVCAAAPVTAFKGAPFPRSRPEATTCTPLKVGAAAPEAAFTGAPNESCAPEPEREVHIGDAECALPIRKSPTSCLPRSTAAAPPKPLAERDLSNGGRLFR